MFLDQRSFLPQDVISRQFNEASKAKEKSIFSISYPFFANSMALYRFRLVDHTFLSENDVSSVKANVRNSFFLYGLCLQLHFYSMQKMNGNLTNNMLEIECVKYYNKSA